jgi:antitoxin component of MazEF toxin-antitoxin module
MELKVRKRGCHLDVRIPRKLAASCGLSLGQKVDIVRSRRGLLISPFGTRKRTLKEMLARMKGPNPYGEIG